MSLLDSHLAFVADLRRAGLQVSLAEGLDAVRALELVRWDERETVRAVYAATLLKRQPQRVTFDQIFDIHYPRLVGVGHGRGDEDPGEEADDPQPPTVRDNAEALADLRERIAEAMEAGDARALADLALEAVGRFGMLPGRGPGMASFSSYSTLQRVRPQELLDRLVAGLVAGGEGRERADVLAQRTVDEFTRLVEADARRRLVEQKGAEHIVRATVRPTLDRLDFLSMRKSDLEAMRREVYPLARRLAARLAKEQHHRRRGALDVRRTVRASLSTGGIPLTTHHRPRRPHRTELVVLCDVSGSVANFASFTLMLVYALREAFSGVRAFTFVDNVVEVTEHFRTGTDVVEVMEGLAGSIQQAALWGRTNYGRALRLFEENHPDAVGPKTSVLILGDARSNYSDLSLDVLKRIEGQARHVWWLNPEHARHWGTGDSAAHEYGALVEMTECRNLTQLAEFVHDIA